MEWKVRNWKSSEGEVEWTELGHVPRTLGTTPRRNNSCAVRVCRHVLPTREALRRAESPKPHHALCVAAPQVRSAELARPRCSGSPRVVCCKRVSSFITDATDALQRPLPHRELHEAGGAAGGQASRHSTPLTVDSEEFSTEDCTSGDWVEIYVTR